MPTEAWIAIGSVLAVGFLSWGSWVTLSIIGLKVKAGKNETEIDAQDTRCTERREWMQELQGTLDRTVALLNRIEGRMERDD